MVKSAVDQAEQTQLTALFTALSAAVPGDPRLAEPLTFWRHQLLVGLEPSQLPELLDVLHAVAALPEVGGDLHNRARYWQQVLEPRAAQPQPPTAPSHPATRSARAR